MSDAEFARVLRINGSVNAAARIEAMNALLKEAADVVRPFATEGVESPFHDRENCKYCRAAAFLAKLDLAAEHNIHIGEGKEGEKP